MNTLIKTIAKTSAALALGTAATIAMPAAAQAAPQAPSAAVSFADLNLSSEQGTEIFDRRIRNAIARVCGGEAPRDLDSRRTYNRCLAETAVAVQPKRDLAINSYREGSLAANDRVIRFVAN